MNPLSTSFTGFEKYVGFVKGGFPTIRTKPLIFPPVIINTRLESHRQEVVERDLVTKRGMSLRNVNPAQAKKKNRRSKEIFGDQGVGRVGTNYIYPSARGLGFFRVSINETLIFETRALVRQTTRGIQP